jgi:ABC-type branched-subunit amino acid transport system substrate-binding protein
MRSAKTRTAAIAVAIATIGFSLTACGDNAPSSGSSGGGGGGEILIGVPVPISGDYASAGEDILHGAELSAKKINDAGGIDGKKIKIVSQDDACSAQTAAQAAQKLISQKVVAVAGGYCSSASLPELAAFHRAGIPFVMDASTNPEITEQGFSEAFRTIFRDDDQGPFVAKFITGYLKAKNVAVLNDSTTYSKGLSDQTVSALKASGANVVYDNALTPGQSDYTSVLTKIAQAKPDVMYYSGYFAEFGLLLKESKQLGLKFQLVGGDANNDPTLIKTAGAAAEGVLVDTAPLAQFLGGAAKDYVSNYTAAYGGTPGPYSAYEYDAVGVVAAAIKKAGSTDSKKITAALHDLGDYEGITGTFHFDDKGDRKPVSYIVITVKDGKFAAYKQFDDATGQWVDPS